MCNVFRIVRYKRESKNFGGYRELQWKIDKETPLNLNSVSILSDCLDIYRMYQEECAKLRESAPYVKVYRCNPKHLCPNLKGYVDNGQRNLKL